MYGVNFSHMCQNLTIQEYAFPTAFIKCGLKKELLCMFAYSMTFNVYFNFRENKIYAIISILLFLSVGVIYLCGFTISDHSDDRLIIVPMTIPIQDINDTSTTFCE